MFDTESTIFYSLLSFNCLNIRNAINATYDILAYDMRDNSTRLIPTIESEHVSSLNSMGSISYPNTVSLKTNPIG